MKANNLPLDLNVHSLRHTNASLLIAQGVDVRTVASLLGHAQASTTLDIYAHAFDKNKRKARDAKRGLFESALLLLHKIHAKQKEQHPIRCCSWCDREDSNLWPSGSEPNALSS